MELFDCERMTGGLLAQPVNSLSSVAFLVAAGVLLPAGRRIEAAVVGVAGVGSMWFHASPSGASEWLHDVGLYAAIAVAALGLWRRLAQSDVPVLATGLFGVGVVIWFFSRTGGPLCDPDGLLQGHAIWHVLAAAAYTTLWVDPRRTSAIPS